MPSPAWENCFRHFATPPPVSPRNDVRGPSAEIPAILMTWLYLDLGSTFDWLKQVSLAARPIRSTTQIWLVLRYGISALVSQVSFGGETSRSTAKCLRLFQNSNALLTSWMDLSHLHRIRILSKAQSCQLLKNLKRPRAQVPQHQILTLFLVLRHKQKKKDQTTFRRSNHRCWSMMT